MFVLQVKEHYVVQTEMLKNRTHQSFLWKDKALCENKDDLIAFAEHNYKDPNIEWRIEHRES